jgi:hypothetical protein
LIETLDSFFEWIAWPMIPPPSYGAFHLLFTSSGFTVCGFTAWILRRVSDKAAGGILFGCGLFHMISGVFKQFSEWFGWYINTPIYFRSLPRSLSDFCFDMPTAKQDTSLPEVTQKTCAIKVKT